MPYAHLRPAHPPKGAKVKKINVSDRTLLLIIFSALSGCAGRKCGYGIWGFLLTHRVLQHIQGNRNLRKAIVKLSSSVHFMYIIQLRIIYYVVINSKQLYRKPHKCIIFLWSNKFVTTYTTKSFSLIW